MTEPLHVYAFQDGVDGPHLCIARRSRLKAYISRREIDHAFSGYAAFMGFPFRLYLGVWGRKNCKRFRRFLRERGAELIIHRDRPPGASLRLWVTHGHREHIRSLPERQS